MARPLPEVEFMTRPYRPLAIANEFIIRAAPDGAEHMKLQKLVYYAYGWWLAYEDAPLISEKPQVWQHGPVFKTLYHALKHHGREPIRTAQSDNPFAKPPKVDPADQKALDLIDWVWERYGSYSSFDLSDMTHSPGSAWYIVAEENNWRVRGETPIPDRVIRSVFRKEADDLGIEIGA